MYHHIFLLLLVLNLSVTVLAGDKAVWPCFHGPQRNNLSTDTGLMRAWPQDGPKLLWTVSGIGHGYSSVAIVGERIFTAGMIDKQTYVTALDKKGKNLFLDEHDSFRLSETARYCIGGVLEHARGIVAYGNPRLNSYKSFSPFFEAPIYIA